MATKTIGIRDDVYERLKAHKRGNESFSETLDRIFQDRDSDWRVNAGFLTVDEAAVLETEVVHGLEDIDVAVCVLGADIETGSGKARCEARRCHVPRGLRQRVPRRHQRF